jgi:hypothetical protein
MHIHEQIKMSFPVVQQQERDEAMKRRAYIHALRAQQASEEVRGFVPTRRNRVVDDTEEGKYYALWLLFLLNTN